MRRKARTGSVEDIEAVVSPEDVLSAREVLNELYMDERVEEYVVKLVLASRHPSNYGVGDLAQLIEYGASPRASINLNLAARAMAFLRHRAYVTPEDVRSVAPSVMQHRMVLTYEAEAERVTQADVVKRLLGAVAVP
jgi:MoxR-like ATPase